MTRGIPTHVVRGTAKAMKRSLIYGIKDGSLGLLLPRLAILGNNRPRLRHFPVDAVET